MDDCIRAFPRDRIQSLLRMRGYPGLSTEVRVEGPFIELGSEGTPIRQVFLAITETELIIVKQECPAVPVFEPSSVPLEVQDLDVDKVFPLAALKFFILDDRARRFTVCTCLDQVSYFEMCQLDLQTEVTWSKWRDVIIDLGGNQGNKFGYKSWKTSYVVNVSKKHLFEIDMLKHIINKPQSRAYYYIHHPHSFYQVKSTGVQTSELDIVQHHFQKRRLINKLYRSLSGNGSNAMPSDVTVEKPDADDNDVRQKETDKNATKESAHDVSHSQNYLEHRRKVKETRDKIFGKCKVQGDDDYDVKADSQNAGIKALSPVSTTKRSRNRSTKLTANEVEHIDAIKAGVSVSRLDCLSKGDSVAVPDKCQSRYTAWMDKRNSSLSFGEKDVHCGPAAMGYEAGAVQGSRSWSEVDSVRGNNGPRETASETLRQYVLKALGTATPSRGPTGWLDWLDRVSPVVKATQPDRPEFTASTLRNTHEPSHRTGEILWLHVRKMVLPRSTVHVLEQQLHETVRHAVFRTHLQRHHYESMSLLDFHPDDVSSELVCMSWQLAQSIAVTDVQMYANSRGKQVTVRLEALERFERDVSKMVSLEVLKHYHMDSVDVINFFVSVCTRLLFRHLDFQSLVAVLKGLTSFPVNRLASLWSAFYGRHPLSYARLVAMLPLITSSKSHRCYARRIRYLNKSNTPYIPLINHLLTHCKVWTPSIMCEVQGQPQLAGHSARVLTARTKRVAIKALLKVKPEDVQSFQESEKPRKIRPDSHNKSITGLLSKKSLENAKPSFDAARDMSTQPTLPPVKVLVDVTPGDATSQRKENNLSTRPTRDGLRQGKLNPETKTSKFKINDLPSNQRRHITSLVSRKNSSVKSILKIHNVSEESLHRSLSQRLFGPKRKVSFFLKKSKTGDNLPRDQQNGKDHSDADVTPVIADTEPEASVHQAIFQKNTSDTDNHELTNEQDNHHLPNTDKLTSQELICCQGNNEQQSKSVDCQEAVTTEDTCLPVTTSLSATASQNETNATARSEVTNSVKSCDVDSAERKRENTEQPIATCQIRRASELSDYSSSSDDSLDGYTGRAYFKKVTHKSSLSSESFGSEVRLIETAEQPTVHKVYRGKIGFGSSLDEASTNARPMDALPQNKNDHPKSLIEKLSMTLPWNKQKVGDPQVQQSSSSKNKRPSFFNRAKKMVKDSHAKEVDHINVLQQDVAEIEDIVDAVRLYPEYVKLDENCARAKMDRYDPTGEDEEANNEAVLVALYGHDHDVDTDDVKANVLPEERPLPYRPELTSCRNKTSLLEVAIEGHASEREEDRAFKDFITNRLGDFKKDGASALDFLKNDRLELKQTRSLVTQPSLSSNIGNRVRSLTHFFQTKTNGMNNNALDTKNNTVTSSKSWPCIADASTKKIIGCDQTQCSLCDNKACIYHPDLTLDLLGLQKALASFPVSTKKNVRSCIGRLLIANAELNDYHLLKLSQTCE